MVGSTKCHGYGITIESTTQVEVSKIGEKFGLVGVSDGEKKRTVGLTIGGLGQSRSSVSDLSPSASDKRVHEPSEVGVLMCALMCMLVKPCVCINVCISMCALMFALGKIRACVCIVFTFILR